MATKKAGAKAPSTEPDKANSLHMDNRPGVTEARQIADLAIEGGAGNSWLTTIFCKGAFGDLSLTECVRSLRATTRAVQSGDLGAAESLLMSQAVALNAIFGEMARRSALNMGEYMDPTDRYMRLALKAQGQCRATLETLAAIKNPPVVFARQANINHGGQQQVNNGSPAAPPTAATDAPQGGGDIESLEAPKLATACDPTQRTSSPSGVSSNACEVSRVGVAKQ